MFQVFVSDEGDFSIASMKADYEAMIASAKLAQMQMTAKPKRKTAAEMTIDISAEKAITIANHCDPL